MSAVFIPTQCYNVTYVDLTRHGPPRLEWPVDEKAILLRADTKLGQGGPQCERSERHAF